MQVARSSIRRLSEIDIAQVEVLKGPQALFFGKNSPAGIISVRTGDPTQTLQARLSSGYEFRARETRTDGYVSAPLTETLGVRVAGYYDQMKGWARNRAPQSGPGTFGHNARSPNQREFAARGTIKWEPTDRLTARIKYTYADIKSNGSSANTQIVACPLGFSQSNGPLEDCRANGTLYQSDVGPNFRNVDARFGDGQTRLHQKQQLGGLELNYALNDDFKLTSTTGYYKVKLFNVGNFTANYLETQVLPRQILTAINFLDVRELTEELRLSTSFRGPVNFLIGALYQDSRAVNGSVTYRNALNPTFVNSFRLAQDGVAKSIYAKAQVALLPTLELSGGARYSYERKKLPNFQTATLAGGPATLREIDGADRAISFNNLSPEATLTFRPSNRLTVYGSYKEGFLSGGYNSVAPILISTTPGATGRFTTLQRPNYDQQTIAGFEAGVKAALLDNALRVNLAAYTYKTKGLQVSVTVQGTQQELRNAGSVRTKGVEADFTYRTPLRGLSLNGAINYNDGRYIDYQASCYRGQSSSTCFSQVNRLNGQTALLQDLSGQRLVRAPRLTGNLGFNFETDLGAMVLGLNGNASHSDGYFTDTLNTPGGVQKGYELYDATVRVATKDQRYELALIGRNLGNKYYFVRSNDNPFSGSVPGASPVGVLGDTAAYVSRGREIMLRLTVGIGG